MNVAQVLRETMQRKGDLSDSARQVLEKYYAHFAADADYWLQNAEPAYEYIYGFLRAADHPRILDVGCGVGTESIAFASHGASVLGIDVTESHLNCARERLSLFGQQRPPVEFSFVNVLDMKESRPFDAVWMNQAYHHLEPRAEVISKLASMVRDGGHIFISDTNAWNPMVQFMLFRARGFQTIREYQDADGTGRLYGRERVTTVGAVVRAFARHGFRCVGRKYYKIFPNSPKFAAAEALLRKASWPAFFYANYAVALVKYEGIDQE
jgi:2-polyprenyl-3-methyl-5-hydroxy-6-metoxy-1,4-benzoquinol methylase